MFIKKQSHVLIVTVILINILLQTTKREGLENKGELKDELKNKISERSDSAKPALSMPDIKNKINKKASAGIGDNATSIDAPSTLRPKDGEIKTNIEALSNLMDKFDLLTEKIGLGKKNKL